MVPVVLIHIYKLHYVLARVEHYINIFGRKVLIIFHFPPLTYQLGSAGYEIERPQYLLHSQRYHRYRYTVSL